MNIELLNKLPYRIDTPSFKSNKLESMDNIDNAYEKYSAQDLGMYTSVIKNSDMSGIISGKLDKIEKENNIKIIYACEAGSKAWGSDSKNSDYDVRYIYVSPRYVYKNLPKKEHITNELNETFDINGFDLSQIVKLLKNDEYNPHELLNSSIKYKETDFSRKLNSIVEESYDVDNMKKHYTNAAKSTYMTKIKNKEYVDPKSYLLTLRFLLSTDYIDKENKTPPLNFQNLFKGEFEKEQVYTIAEKLLENKRKGNKSDTIKSIPEMNDYIENKIYEQQENQKLYKPREKNFLNVETFFNNTINSKDFDDINKIVLTPIEKDRMNAFPKDVDYKKEILLYLGYPMDNHLALRSIVGPQEFGYVINKFDNNPDAYSAGEVTIENSDKTVLTNVMNKKYRANMHIHTLYSDGKMSVKELLDNSAKYANNIANYFENNNIKDYEPFTIAITDHNTTEGAKEAVKIIYDNPEKYKNLRVVLGIELSASEVDNSNKNRQVHILAQSINPFDDEMNAKLNKRIDEKHPFYGSLGSIRDTISILESQPDCFVGYAHPLAHLSPALPNEEKKDIVMDLLRRFYESSGGHRQYVENYYQSYNDDFGNDEDSLKVIKDFSDEFNFPSVGGMDTHGNSIYKY